MDQDMASAAVRPGPLTPEDMRALEAIGDPVLVATRSGSVAFANESAHLLLPREDPSRIHLTGKASTAFLARVRAAGRPLPGVVAVKRGTGVRRYRCQGCRLNRNRLDPLVLVRLLSVRDARFSLLANEAVTLRRELAERERYQQRLQALLRERDLLLADLRSTDQARTRAECDRDAVLAQLYRAHQAERERLARELHDEAGQQLAWLKLRLDRLRREPSPEEVGAMLNQVDAISASLRQVVRELRPVALAELGLILALNGLVREWSDRCGVPIEFQLSGASVPLTPEIEVTIFRLVQEALTNIVKHAPGSGHVSVTLQYNRDGVTLAIEDDGPGLGPDPESESVDGPVSEKCRAGSGFGLAGMRERLMLLGGKLLIESPPGGGTTILARLPLLRACR
ncbi:histidine kinase [Methylorubrum populi]|uniref:Oxygen sensor histidine kinase NreB n=2 Tax=Methylorubrum populi TaxID=223967 RepID=A0A161J7F7_9HYPH|nr:histidine kinase [Methylorubrum populi]